MTTQTRDGESGLTRHLVRKLAAILAADMVGYSRLTGIDEEGTVERLQSARQNLIDPTTAQHGGRIIKSTGDGFLAEFGSVVDAVRCAVAIQRGMALRNVAVPADRHIVFRMGIHIGDVVIESEDLLGDAVNIAARLESIAEPGCICLSEDAYRQSKGKLDIVVEDWGERHLKNIADPVRVFCTMGKSEERPAPAMSLPDKPSIAVLPFQNMSGDPEQEYFADGIVEEITTAIARLPWLFVIARNSSFTYKGRAIGVKQVGRELGVRYVLEGSVRRAGNRVRITGQLIDTSNAAHIWADRFESTFEDIFDLQDQVASSVCAAIEPRLKLSEIERATRKPTGRLDAYDLYLRALAQVHRLTPESTDRAHDLAIKAHAIDRAYAPAAALAGWCRAVQKWQGWIVPSASEYAEGVRFAREAIASGRDDPDMLWMAGHTIAYLAADHTTGLAAIGRALTLNVNSAQAWGAKGLIESYLGKAKPAIAAFTRAIRLSPLDPLGYHYKFGIALGHLSDGRYDEALEWVNQSLADQPQFHAGARVKLALCGLLGLADEARDALQRLLKLQPGFTVSAFASHASTFLSPAMTSTMVDGLRKGGLPEN